MSRTAQLIVGAITDFVLTATATVTGAMAANGAVAMPSQAVWLLAVLFGLGAAAKQVRGMLLDLKPLVVLLALSFALTGCVALNGPAIYVKCAGKGALTGTASLGGGFMYGGGGTNTGTLQADCGDGFEYYRGPKKPKEMPPAQ